MAGWCRNDGGVREWRGGAGMTNAGFLHSLYSPTSGHFLNYAKLSQCFNEVFTLGYTLHSHGSSRLSVKRRTRNEKLLLYSKWPGTSPEE